MFRPVSDSSRWFTMVLHGSPFHDTRHCSHRAHCTRCPHSSIVVALTRAEVRNRAAMPAGQMPAGRRPPGRWSSEGPRSLPSPTLYRVRPAKSRHGDKPDDGQDDGQDERSGDGRGLHGKSRPCRAHGASVSPVRGRRFPFGFAPMPHIWPPVRQIFPPRIVRTFQFGNQGDKTGRQTGRQQGTRPVSTWRIGKSMALLAHDIFRG